jgi:ABC-type nickel/cobalt efflux system permease component RcnA
MNSDYLLHWLRGGETGGQALLFGLTLAFVLGAIHALSPGHGKTIVAAYLVGSRGTVRHALLLGGVVTFTHTASVFALGFGTLFLSRYVVPDRIVPVLGVVSGVSIVWIGALLLFRRVRALRHGHAHGHDHPHHHHHPHTHSHAHPHSHAHEGGVSVAGLVALGASGGLVPCPSALVLLLASVAAHKTALGLILLTAFSAGLAGVLMGIGVAVLYAGRLLPDSERASRHPLLRYLPVASAGVIVAVGLFMTAVAAGVVRPGWFVA